MSHPFSDWLHGAELAEQGSTDVRVDSPRCRAARLEDLDGGLVPFPDDHLGARSRSPDLRAELAAAAVGASEDDGVGREAPRRHDQAGTTVGRGDLDAT